ncbi:phosphoribosylaminoimidazolecarboxamide formyltransferase [candidate division WOR-3 bacterium]|nr:phosphoribosylaminoimidazolecarboxamide formyltransferase [candidate division WOR-3 bacterium]
MDELRLRYGINPHQSRARAFVEGGELPFDVLNGQPGFVNLLDALNSWQLVCELKQLSGLPAAASFKHVSPAGAAIGRPLTPELAHSFGVEADGLPPLACAYARARGADRMSSFGDWAAFSDMVDLGTASMLGKEVSDGCIAPGYEPAALDLLKTKKKGNYPILEARADFVPPDTETRQVFGVRLEQARNSAAINADLLKNVVTHNKAIPDPARLDMLIATLVLKYTQSNSVCVAHDGQAIGVGAGQQSRIACTRIACTKADHWLLRLHPKVQAFDWKKGVSRSEKATAIELYLSGDASEAELAAWRLHFNAVPAPLAANERQQWIAGFKGLSLSSDAFIPFRDNIDRAARSGVRYVVQTGGSAFDAGIIRAADEYGMVMALTGLRLFHH